MELNEWAQEAYRIAEKRGWHDPKEIEGVVRKASAGERVALMHEECTELMRHVRNGSPGGFYIEIDGKPEGAASEVADIIIRALDYAATYDIDVDNVVRHKMAYNEGRQDWEARTVL